MTQYILFIVIGIALLLFLPMLMARRAIAKLLKKFRAHNALSPDTAKTPAELGIKAQTIMDRMVRKRDYQHQVLLMFLESEVVQATEDGKIYLVEEKLSHTKWADQ